MATHEFHARKGLIVANTLFHATNNRIGIHTSNPSVTLHVNSTDGIIVPIGNNAQRPSGTVGLFRYNSESSDYEFYRGSSWVTFTDIAANVTAETVDALLDQTSNTHVLFDDENDFGGSAGLVFIKTSNNLSVGNTVNAAVHSIGSTWIANTLGLYHTGTVNAAIHSIGSTWIANTLGLYHTGTVNAASFSVGPSTVSNSTGVFTQGTVNAVTVSVGPVFVANNSRVYHDVQMLVNTNFVANTLGVYHTGTVNAAVHSIDSTWIANTLGLYHTGTVNASSFSVGSSITANSTRLSIGSAVGIVANGGIGSAGQALHSNGSSIYWATLPTYVSQVSTANGLSGGPITGTGTISIVANNGLTTNTSGLFVVQGTGTVVNASGIHVNSSFIATLSANNASFLGGVAAAGYQTTSGLAAAVAGLTALNSTQLGGVAAANFVTGSSLSSTLASYQTISGLASAVSSLTAYNANYLGGVISSDYSRKTGQSYTGQHVFYGNGLYANATVGCGITAYTQDSSSGSVLGFSQNQTKYAILGHINTYSLYGVGDLFTSGAGLFGGNVIAYYSDKRLKKDIEPIRNALSKLCQIVGVTYKQNNIAANFGYEENKEEIGVIAQEVQKVIPQAVHPAPFDIEIKDGQRISKSGENYLTVDMTKIIPLIIESIKELDNRLTHIESKI